MVQTPYTCIWIKIKTETLDLKWTTQQQIPTGPPDTNMI